MLAFYVKLGALLVKQVSKPLATQLKSTAMQHPAMQRYLIRFGQRMHEFNSSLSQKLKSEGELAGRKARARPGGRERLCADSQPLPTPGVCDQAGRRCGAEEGG